MWAPKQTAWLNEVIWEDTPIWLPESDIIVLQHHHYFAILSEEHIKEEDGGKGEQTSIHYKDVMMGALASQITSITIVYSTVY